MCHYKRIKVADELINLTNETINVYDQYSGEIVEIAPVSQELPELPKNDSRIYYILERKVASRLRKTRRPLDDIAIAEHKGPGRDGFMITSLTWGKDKCKSVGLCRTNFHLR